MKLYITGIRNEDAGRYTCRGEIDGTGQEKSLELEVKSKYMLGYHKYYASKVTKHD